MKASQIFVDIFCIFVFLTIGSLLLIVGLRVLPLEDAFIKIQALYDDSGQRVRLSIAGVVMIVTGFALTKSMLKRMKADDEFIFEGEEGYVTLTFSVINEFVQRALKRFEGVRQSTIKTTYDQGILKIDLRLSIAPGVNLAELVKLVEAEVHEQVGKTMGHDIPFQLKASIVKIEKSPFESVPLESNGK